MRKDQHKTAEDHKKFAQAVAGGASIREAMVTAGFSDKQARKGRAALSKPMIEALAAQSKELIELGKKFDAEQLEHMVVGRLVMNTMNGSDDGVQSAKQLGNHKSLALWQPENVTGIFLNRPPKEFEKFITLDAEVKD